MRKPFLWKQKRVQINLDTHVVVFAPLLLAVWTKANHEVRPQGYKAEVSMKFILLINNIMPRKDRAHHQLVEQTWLLFYMLPK